MDRTDHQLEGWDGYEIQEYRLSPTSDEWRDVRELSRMDAAHRAAMMKVSQAAVSQLFSGKYAAEGWTPMIDRIKALKEVEEVH